MSTALAILTSKDVQTQKSLLPLVSHIKDGVGYREFIEEYEKITGKSIDNLAEPKKSITLSQIAKSVAKNNEQVKKSDEPSL